MGYFRLIFVVIFLITIGLNTAFASTNLDTNLAEDCKTLLCVRKNIDEIDSKMVSLIGLRLSYVKRAGELKQGKQPVHDQKRENEILLKVKNLAIKAGYPGSIAVEIYKTLLVQTNIYEQEIVLKKRV